MMYYMELAAYYTGRLTVIAIGRPARYTKLVDAGAIWRKKLKYIVVV